MAYIPFTPEIGCKYTLTGPDGSIATFNDKTDPNYVGVLTDVTGLDSATVREVGDDYVQADGGWNANFYYGRRPITMSGTVIAPISPTDRTARIDRLRTASNAMRGDAVLSWLPTAVGAIQMRTWVRRQQPLRITGAWNKDFQLLLISQFAPLFSDVVYTSAVTNAGTSLSVENHGDAPSYPIININGNGGTPIITNTTANQFVTLTTALSTGTTLSIDVANHRAFLSDGTDESSALDFVNSTWPSIIRGINGFSLTGAASFWLTWRDAWT